MERDVKVGLVLGVLLVAVIAIVFFRRDNTTPSPPLASAQQQEPSPDELPVIRNGPAPYHISADYLRQLLQPRLAAERREPAEQPEAKPRAHEPAAISSRRQTASASSTESVLPSIQTPPPEPPQLRAAPRPGAEYVVRPGDTLASIARAAYGSERYYRALYEANRDVLFSPNELPVGVLIRIPVLQDQRSAAADSATVPDGPSQTVGGTYRVQPGETLRSIARKLYGDEQMYRRIYRANRDQLASPGDLRPGMVLRIP